MYVSLFRLLAEDWWRYTGRRGYVLRLALILARGMLGFRVEEPLRVVAARDGHLAIR